MKVDISYVLQGRYVAKTVLLRSLDRVLAAAEKSGAAAIRLITILNARQYPRMNNQPALPLDKG
jgi:hypothetical protein